jgi:hypothetical protein
LRIGQFTCREAIQLEAKFALANLINSLVNLIFEDKSMKTKTYCAYGNSLAVEQFNWKLNLR